MSRPPHKSSDAKADALVLQAEKKLNSSSLFGFLSGGNKFEDAIDLYEKAASQYKLSKEWDCAALAHMNAAECAEKNKDSISASQHYLSAAKAYKNTNVKDAIKTYKITIELYKDSNRISSAAKLWKEIGELETKENNLSAAIEAYEQAAVCFEAEDGSASANGCKVEVARLCAEDEKYSKAIQIYEQIAKSAADSQLGRWSVKDYLYKSSLCHFIVAAQAGEMSKMTDTLERYKDQFPGYDGSREAKLVESLVVAFEADDVEKYTDIVFKFDQLTRLDPWSAKVLLAVKQIMKGEGEHARDEVTEVGSGLG